MLDNYASGIFAPKNKNQTNKTKKNQQKNKNKNQKKSQVIEPTENPKSHY